MTNSFTEAVVIPVARIDAILQVEVELNITNRNVDLVAEGFDLAIRLGQLPDSGVVARKLEDAELCLVSSPDYLEREGTPQDLASLQQHNCIPFQMPRSN